MTSFEETDDVSDYDYDKFDNDIMLRMSQQLAYGNYICALFRWETSN